MGILSKCALGAILIAVLVLLPLNTIWTRDSMKELVRGSERQNEVLQSINDNLSSQLSQLDEVLQGNNDTLLNQLTQLSEALANVSNQLKSMNTGIIWSYGTGLPGNGEGELYSPHMADELDGNKILITEQKNNDVIVVDKISGEIVWQFGERGLPGTGTRLSEPHSAHRLPDGRILITEYLGDHRVLIVNYDTKAIEWEYTGSAKPLDAIYWDDEHIMIADEGLEGDGKIIKVKLSDKATVWSYSTDAPFYLQKLKTGDYGQSYGGDLLFGQVGNFAAKEIDTLTRVVKWQYGADGINWPLGESYDRVWSPVCALRYGISEVLESKNPSLTIIVSENWSKIFAVNKAKELVWEIGGIASPDPSSSALPTYTGFPLLEPTYVSVTKGGNLLITDHGQNKVFEVNVNLIAPRTDKEIILSYGDQTTDSWTDSQIAEVIGYKNKNISIFNKGANDLEWRIIGSSNNQDWVEIKSADILQNADSSYYASYYVVTSPWRFIKVQIKSNVPGQTTITNIYLHASKD